MNDAKTIFTLIFSCVLYVFEAILKESIYKSPMQLTTDVVLKH